MFAKRISSGGLLLCLLLSGVVLCQRGRTDATTYYGMSDASAGIAVNDTLFITIDDERNVFEVYGTDRPGAPLQSLPWDAHLGIAADDEHPEADIEGAAVLGKNVYWISSHGRNKDGKWRANRHRFFAMNLEAKDGQVRAAPVGKPCTRLATCLAEDPRYQQLGIADSLAPERKKDETLAPKDGGLNIEALAAGADGKSLLIGLRNPRPGGMALIVPLLNPEAVLLEGAAPKFGEPVRLRLTRDANGQAVGLGIRSMEYSPRHKAYLIIAGSHDERGAFACYRWSGRPSDAPELLPRATAAIAAVPSFSPEALIVYPDREKVQLLSDDGSRLVRVASPDQCKKGAYRNGACEAKSLLDHSKKTFRSLWIDVE
jgi:hypothetical protein